MKLLASILFACSLAAQTPVTSLTQSAKVSFYGDTGPVVAGQLVKMTQGGLLSGGINFIAVSSLVAADSGPVILGIATGAANTGFPVNVCTFGECLCQFSHNPSIPAQRGAIVVADPLTSTCRVATTGTSSGNNILTKISQYQGIVGWLSDAACVDTGFCKVDFAGPWRSGAQMGPFVADTVDLTLGLAALNSYNTWVPTNSQFRHIPYTGNLHNGGVAPPCYAGSTCSFVLGGPGLITPGHHSLGVFWRTEDDIRNTPDDQLSVETVGETIIPVIMQANITDNTVAGQIVVTLPVSTNKRVVKVCTAMSKSGENGNIRLHVIECVPASQATYTINIADADLTPLRYAPQCDTTSGQFFTNGWTDRLSCISIQSFWDGSYFLGPDAGNGKDYIGQGTIGVGGTAGKFMQNVNHGSVFGGGGTANGGYFGFDGRNNTDTPTLFGYALSVKDTLGVPHHDCTLMGTNMPCDYDGQLKFSSASADDGKIFMQFGREVKAGPKGISLSCPGPVQNPVYTNGILTGGTC